MTLHTYLDYQVILANQGQTVCFAIRFEEPRLAKPRPHPAGFCLLLDRSGSMSGQPLAMAQQASQVAVRNLRPADQFGLVVFDSEAPVLIPLQPAAQKEQFLNVIAQTDLRGSTILTAGWALGRDGLKNCKRGIIPWP